MKMVPAERVVEMGEEKGRHEERARWEKIF
jgi:hypothetical protein